MTSLIKRRLSAKILVIVISGIMLSLGIALSVFAYIYYRAILNETRDLSGQSLRLITNYLDDAFETTDKALTNFILQERLQEDNRQWDRSLQLDLQDFCYVYPQYSNAYACLISQGTVYSAYRGQHGWLSFRTVSGSDWFRDVMTHYDFHVSLCQINEDTSIACTRLLRDISDMQPYGYVMGKLPFQYITDLLASNNESQRNNLFCITDNQDLIASDLTTPVQLVDLNAIDPSLLTRSSFSVRSGGYEISGIHVTNSDLYIVNYMPLAFSRIANLRILLFGFIVILLLILAVVFVIIRFMRRTIEPLNLLAAQMEAAELDQMEPLSVPPREDEIGRITKRYNKMIRRFNAMLDTQYRYTIELKESQLQALQFQINPHFVNNTLQTIGVIAVENEMMDIYDLICAFSNIFYYILRFSNDVVAFQDELDYMNDYIIIQNARFPGKFEITYEIDEALKGFEIPKMVLQPIVENCFSHAFFGMRSGWQIHIHTQQLKNSWKVIITDNGQGLTEEQLRTLVENVDKPYTKETYRPGNSIGLRNVNIRIKLLYGTSYGLSFDSTPGKGTSVTVTLPKRQTERSISCPDF